eukprot:2316967-Rhodomonas_salina.2
MSWSEDSTAAEDDDNRRTMRTFDSGNRKPEGRRGLRQIRFKNASYHTCTALKHNSSRFRPTQSYYKGQICTRHRDD